MLDLTNDQVADAEACGVSFPPATPQQVQRYAMQRKVFRVGGTAVLATRGGALFETAGTLARLIAEGGRRRRDLAGREAAASEPEVETPAPPPPPAAEPASRPMVMTEPSAAAPVAGPRGTPRGQRWRTAGAVRRGRLAQHWTSRQRG